MGMQGLRKAKGLNHMRQGFDNDKYIALQAEHIRSRINQFGGKLYLEFGGKLFDDYHASRVLPGFEPDSKFRMLKTMVDEVEIIIAINANHIEKSKTRGDLGITYDEEVLRLLDVFRSRGFATCGVPLAPRRPGHQELSALPHCRVPLRHRAHRLRRGLRQKRVRGNDAPARRGDRARPRIGQDGHLPLAALPRAQARQPGGIREIRDVPHLQSAAETSRQHRLRGRDSRSGRRELHRPLPPGGLREDHGELQPRRGDLPRT